MKTVKKYVVVEYHGNELPACRSYTFDDVYYCGSNIVFEGTLEECKKYFSSRETEVSSVYKTSIKTECCDVSFYTLEEHEVEINENGEEEIIEINELYCTDDYTDVIKDYQNVRLEHFDNGAGYNMIICDLVLDNGEVIKDVAEYVYVDDYDNTYRLEEIDCNLDAHEDRLTKLQIDDVKYFFSDWLYISNSSLYDYVQAQEIHNNKNYELEVKDNQIVIIDKDTQKIYKISFVKLNEIRTSLFENYKNIELDD